MRRVIYFLATALAVLVVSIKLAQAQGSVGVNTKSPNTNAALDIQSLGKQGVLIPRLSAADTLVAPLKSSFLSAKDKGLLFYDTVGLQFIHWNGVRWQSFGKNSGGVGPQGPIGLTGATGPAGPQGVIGLTGPQGNTGLTGAQGPAGNDGAVGPQGPIGLTGVAGPTGPQGIIGLTGLQGPAGNDGAVGPQGPIGLTGVTGPIGPQGVIGLTGLQGPAGNDGAVGPQGPIGLTGATGPIGLQGVIGLTGLQGPAGNDGLDGFDGLDGLDGYTVLNGISDPVNATGIDGDFYINTNTNKIFGPKFGGVWSSGTSLIGPAGSFSVTGTIGQTIYHNGTDWKATSNLYNDGTTVGIGTASISANKLLIKSAGNVSIPLAVQTSGNTNSLFEVGQLNTGDGIIRGFTNAGATGYYITTSGESYMQSSLGVGMNGTIPQKLTVNGNAMILNGSSLMFREPSASGTNTTSFKATAQSSDITYTLPASIGNTNDVLVTDNSGNLSWTTIPVPTNYWMYGGNKPGAVVNFGTNDAFDLPFVTSGIERMRITKAGKVGIGNPSPNEVLDVSGNISFSGALMPNATAGASGQVLTSNGAGNSPKWNNLYGISGGTANYLPKWTSATALSSTSLLYDDGTGIAIGSANPIGAKLRVSGDAIIIDNNNTGIEITNSTSIGDGYAQMVYDINTGATGTPSMRYVFQPRNNANTGTNTFAEMKFGKVASQEYGYVSFSTRNAASIYAERMRLDAEGRLGIGTSPSQALDVLGNVRFSGALMPNNTAGTSGQVLVSTGAGSVPTWSTIIGTIVGGSDEQTLRHNGASWVPSSVLTNDGTNISIGSNASTARLTITPTSSGHAISMYENNSTTDYWYEGVRTSDSYKYHGFKGMYRGAYSAIDGVYTSASDSKLKKNVAGLEKTLESVIKLRPVKYHMNEQKDTDMQRIGFIAQEVKEYFPEFVEYSEEEKLYSINYGSMSVIAIKAIQEQQKIIEGLQTQIDALQQQVNSLLFK